jgi:hypothetical protein
VAGQATHAPSATRTQPRHPYTATSTSYPRRATSSAMPRPASPRSR